FSNPSVEAQELVLELTGECMEEYGDPRTIGIGFATVARTLVTLLAHAEGSSEEAIIDVVYTALIAAVPDPEAPDEAPDEAP
ncbi:MAG TPA: hypothetical protein DCP11_08335, partial [Microbacteriaceae bacterium]|nr:hypothetical protein [Microbacteriaceae bacterium]